ncbi:MAG TPA: matrixin family metalloprotease [Sandaracinaceae bacterium LLY-WYZ-13_1]|nr:matrixin family metalloprotease [Sandaracinaceae bacterium LLY-WYZ-13_1]
MRRLLFAFVLVAPLGVAGPALAWQPIASGNPTWVPPVPYSLNQEGSADLGGFGPTESEVQTAMDDWTLVSCTSLTTDYRGSTTRTAGSYEGTSTIGWVESGWRHSSSAIGVTGPRWGRNIIEADMEMNGVNFSWTTGSGSFSNVNAYSIILHEGGHYYGLGHTDVRGSSMWPSYGGGIIGLGPDDEAGICALYPGSGTDCTTTGCPSGQECVEGTCQTMVGDGTICAPCTRSSECGGSSDYCLGYPDGSGYCGRSCGGDGDCEGGRCVSTSAGRQCVQFDGSQPSCATSSTGCTRDSDCGADEICDGGSCVPRPTTGSELGEPCMGDGDCQSGLCIGGRCTSSCDWTNPTGSCPTGFYCDADVSTSCDTGYCVEGSPGGGELGDECSEDDDCESLHCDGETCSQACIPGGALACPSGYACQVGSLSCRGSCRRSGALGDECEVNDDCTTGICAEQGDRQFCTDLCGDADACPDGFTCTPVGGDASVCVPDSGGLGEACAGNEDCLSGLCAAEGERSYCTRPCDDSTPCPGGSYECVPTGDMSTSVCRPVDEGCGCRVIGGRSGRGGLALLGLLGLVLGLVWRRRRR